GRHSVFQTDPGTTTGRQSPSRNPYVETKVIPSPRLDAIRSCCYLTRVIARRTADGGEGDGADDQAE
ncbi:hypothetical protein JW905_12890, partial [bacterium]|nr:hypothetical protein [candidate division CSSED10-310 bacterium]